MNLLPILAIGAVAILMSSQKSSSSTKKKKDENNYDGLVLKGVPADPKPDDEKGEVVLKGGGCGSLEYLSNGKCYPFWTNIETDNLVYKEILKQIKVMKLTTWEAKCGAGKNEYGEYVLENPNIKIILKKVVATLWESANLTEKMLPPKESDPEWIRIVWGKVKTIYLNQICQIYDEKNYEGY